MIMRLSRPGMVSFFESGDPIFKEINKDFGYANVSDMLDTM